MEIILTPQCKSLTGGIGKRYGYFLVKRKERFFSQRSRHLVPPEGHWQFILAFSELAKNGLYIKDIQVSGYELKAALNEAALIASALYVDVDNEYSAIEVLQFKKERGL